MKYKANVTVVFRVEKNIEVEFEVEGCDDPEAIAESEACLELTDRYGDIGEIQDVCVNKVFPMTKEK